MIHFIVNEASGRGRAAAMWREMRRALLTAGVPFRAWTTHAAGEAALLAQMAEAETSEVTKLVVVGGDGTVNEVLNGVGDLSKVALGVVPLGSGNDFARGLRMNGDPWKALHRVLAASGKRRIDIGEVCADDAPPRRFGISASVGMDAWVCQAVDASPQKARLNRLGLGSLTYGLMTLSAAWHLEHADARITAETPLGQVGLNVDGLIFLACMNFPWEGGGVPIAPDASANDGLFSICLAHGLTRPQVFTKLPRLACGKHTHCNGVSLFTASAIDVRLSQPMVVHADGEVPGRVRHATFKVLPQKLRVLV